MKRSALLLVLATLLLVAGCSLGSPGESSRPLLYVFHSQWCAACPTPAEIKALAARYPHAWVYDVDIDQRPDLKASYNVESVPYFYLSFDGGSSWGATHNMQEAEQWLNEGRFSI